MWSRAIRLSASRLVLSVATLLPRKLVHHHALDIFVVFVVFFVFAVFVVFAVVVVVVYAVVDTCVAFCWPPGSRPFRLRLKALLFCFFSHVPKVV